MLLAGTFSGTFSIQILSFLSQFGTFFQLSPADFGYVFEQYQANLEFPLEQVVYGTSGYLQTLFQPIAF